MADSLAGRMDVLTLLPFAGCELERRPGRWLDQVLAGQLTNLNQLAGQLGLDHKTAARYLGVLEQLFLVRRLHPWRINPLARLVKTPKLQFLDSGLLANLLGIDSATVQRDRTRFGALLESYVVAELFKLAGWSDGEAQLFSWRDTETSTEKSKPE